MRIVLVYDTILALILLFCFGTLYTYRNKVVGMQSQIYPLFDCSRQYKFWQDK